MFKFTNCVFLRIDCPQRSLSRASATQCHGFLLHCPDTVARQCGRRSDAVMREAEVVALNELQDSDLRPGSKVSLGDCTQVRGTEYPERARREFLMGILNLKVALSPAGPLLHFAVIPWHRLRSGCFFFFFTPGGWSGEHHLAQGGSQNRCYCSRVQLKRSFA